MAVKHLDESIEYFSCPNAVGSVGVKAMVGRRVYPDANGHLTLGELGDYGKDLDGKWWAHAPAKGCPVGVLSDHTVIEHDDGTISVSPSILWPDKYHGYLEGGVWRSC